LPALSPAAFLQGASHPDTRQCAAVRLSYPASFSCLVSFCFEIFGWKFGSAGIGFSQGHELVPGGKMLYFTTNPILLALQGQANVSPVQPWQKRGQYESPPPVVSPFQKAEMGGPLYL
jgi:hypothetical protein